MFQYYFLNEEEALAVACTDWLTKQACLALCVCMVTHGTKPAFKPDFAHNERSIAVN